jgi:hypothetical protein
MMTMNEPISHVTTDVCVEMPMLDELLCKFSVTAVS